jgi:hypothetical protein
MRIDVPDAPAVSPDKLSQVTLAPLAAFEIVASEQATHIAFTTYFVVLLKPESPAPVQVTVLSFVVKVETTFSWPDPGPEVNKIVVPL